VGRYTFGAAVAAASRDDIAESISRWVAVLVAGTAVERLRARLDNTIGVRVYTDIHDLGRSLRASV
jgi:hypothetical protein